MLPKGSLFSKKEAPGAACALQTRVWKSQNSALSHSVSQEFTGMARVNLSHLWMEVVTCPCEDGGARAPSEAGPVKTLKLLPVS